MSYILINPRFEGTNISSKKKSNSDAASEIWSNLSGNIKNFVPKFYFTIQDTQNGGLSHFVVKESFKKDKVKYKLKQYKNKKMNNDEINKLFSQEGSGRKEHKKKNKYSLDDDDSSSSSSSSSGFVYSYPLGTDWKNTSLYYYPGIYASAAFTFPTWKLPITSYLTFPPYSINFSTLTWTT